MPVAASKISDAQDGPAAGGDDRPRKAYGAMHRHGSTRALFQSRAGNRLFIGAVNTRWRKARWCQVPARRNIQDGGVLLGAVVQRRHLGQDERLRHAGIEAAGLKANRGGVITFPARTACAFRQTP